MEGDVITLQDIFLFDHGLGFDDDGRALGTLKSTGLRPKFLDKLAASGVQLDPSIFAFEKFANR
jgi:pilus assembly protein CpaF